MNGLKNSRIYKRLGLRGLKVFCYVWFPLFFLTFAIILVLSIFLFEGSTLIVSLALTLIGILLLTRMFLSFFAEFRSFRNEEADDRDRGESRKIP